MEAYVDKGRVSPVLEKIPLFAVLGEDLGIRGVHKVAMQEYQQIKGETSQKGQSNALPWISIVLAGAIGSVAGIFFSRSRLSK